MHLFLLSYNIDKKKKILLCVTYAGSSSIGKSLTSLFSSATLGETNKTYTNIDNGNQWTQLSLDHLKPLPFSSDSANTFIGSAF